MPDTSPTPVDGFDAADDLVTASLRDYMATLPGQNWSAEDAPDLALHVVNELDDKGLLRSRASIGPDSREAKNVECLQCGHWMRHHAETGCQVVTGGIEWGSDYLCLCERKGAIGPDSERIRELEAENARLRNRGVGEKFDDLMNNLPSEHIDYDEMLDD